MSFKGENGKLALFGGDKAVTEPFQPYNSIGEEELHAVEEVLKTGVLSKYLGTWSPDFYGGPKVQEFESIVGNFLR